MAPRFTSFNPNWKRNYLWIDAVSGDKYRAFCKYCKKSFSIAAKGEGCIKEHANTDKHKAAERDVASSHSMVRFTTGQEEQKVAAQEAVSVYHMIQEGHSFNSATCNSKLIHSIYGSFGEDFIERKISKMISL